MAWLPNYRDGDGVAQRHALSDLDFTGQESMTKQSMAHETDVNVIMSKYLQSGDLTPFLSKASPIYGDVSGIGDYHEAVNAVKVAEEAFALLPANIRDKFGNDPAVLVAAFDDPSQHGMLTELGLIKAPPAEPSAPADGTVEPA